MNKLPYILTAAVISFTGALNAAENRAISGAGLALPEVSVPSPAAPKSNQWMTLRKIAVNEAQPDMNDTLIGLVEHGQDIDKAVKELNDAGFKAAPYQDNLGGYMVLVDVTGLNAADYAVGLARYYYISQVKVGQRVFDQLFGLNRSRSSYAARIGTVRGGLNGSPADITLDKIAWTITGGMNGSPVDVKINHDEKTISGGANLSPVDLKFAWSTEEVAVYGGANHSPVGYTVNWNSGLLEGYSNNAPLRLEFAMNEGDAAARTVAVKGYARNAPVDLSYDKVTGRLSGGMNGAPVDVTLVNCDLYDFLQYFFLFLGK